MCSIGLNDATGRRIIEIELLELSFNPISLGWAYRWFLWFLSRYYTSWTLAWSGNKWVLVARFRWIFNLWSPWGLYYSFSTQNLSIYVFYGSIHPVWVKIHAWVSVSPLPQKVSKENVQSRCNVNVYVKNEFHRLRRLQSVKGHPNRESYADIQLDSKQVAMYVAVIDLE